MGLCVTSGSVDPFPGLVYPDCSLVYVNVFDTERLDLARAKTGACGQEVDGIEDIPRLPFAPVFFHPFFLEQSLSLFTSENAFPFLSLLPGKTSII